MSPGSISFSGHGAQSLSINQAEVLRAIRIVNDYVPETDLRLKPGKTVDSPRVQR